MPCALCLRNEPLRKSHIIPEFFYTAMYDKGHQYFVLSTNHDDRRRTKPKGLYERLMCAECEEKNGQWDDYAKKVLFNETKLERVQIDRQVVVFKGVEYERFKLFQMSLLWRASVANRPEFELAKLGGPHEERLRRMLLDNNPGRPHDYGCVLWNQRTRQDAQDAMNELIDAPEQLSTKIHGHHIYRAIFGGFWWMWIVSSHSSQFPQQGFLGVDGVLLSTPG